MKKTKKQKDAHAALSNQRLFDLVRQQRMELFQANLIDEAEYAMLAGTHGGVQRLEDYDGVRAEVERLKTAEREDAVRIHEALKSLGDRIMSISAERDEARRQRDEALVLVMNPSDAAAKIARAIDVARVCDAQREACAAPWDSGDLASKHIATCIRATPLVEDAPAVKPPEPPEPEWVVNSNAELGVKVGDRFYFLYKGHNIVYREEKLFWRPVTKREFGECCHPLGSGTVDIDDGEVWRPLPLPGGSDD